MNRLLVIALDQSIGKTQYGLFDALSILSQIFLCLLTINPFFPQFLILTVLCGIKY